MKRLLLVVLTISELQGGAQDTITIRMPEIVTAGITVNMPAEGRKASGQVLSSTKLTDINTFENPAKISIQNFGGLRIVGQAIQGQENSLLVMLPPKSLVVLTLQ